MSDINIDQLVHDARDVRELVRRAGIQVRDDALRVRVMGAELEVGAAEITCLERPQLMPVAAQMDAGRSST